MPHGEFARAVDPRTAACLSASHLVEGDSVFSTVIPSSLGRHSLISSRAA